MPVLSSVFKAFLGIDGMTVWDLRHEEYRNRFSEYLPWIAYDPDSKAYYCTDNGRGWIIECTPLAFASENTVDTLEGLLRLGAPDGSILQFILIADNYIDHYIDAYKSVKTRSDGLSRESTERFTEFLRDGTRGISQLNYVPVRDFRLIVTFKVPEKDWASETANVEELRNSLFEILSGASLFPKFVEAQDLVHWMRRLFNQTYTGSGLGYYNDDIRINRQIIFAETPIQKEMKELHIGDRYYRCITPRSVPKEITLIQSNLLFGGIWGVQHDINQYRTPFIYCLNVYFSGLRAKLHAKCNTILQQKGFGSFALQHQARQEEHQWAVDELEKGRRFLRLMPILWVYGEDRQTVSESLVRAKRLWEDCGYIMQEDRGILPIMFISSLPLGLYNDGKNIDNLDRDFIAPSDTIATLLPTQADFAGGGKPHILLTGRKGQICGLDLFDKDANNNNAFITAQPGAGKSFFINYLAYNYYSAGAKIRIIDIGDSYLKMTKLCNAKYLDFGRDKMSINPFQSIVDEEYDLPVIAQIAAQMSYSNTDSVNPTEIELQLLQNAVNWAYDTEGKDAEIDLVYDYLRTYPQNAHTDDHTQMIASLSEELINTAQKLAFNMRQFSREGLYGGFFNGPSDFNIYEDEFVVLELGKLSDQKALFNVATLQVINAVTNDFYHSDRSEKKLVVFDEAWQFIRDNSVMQKVIEDGYRKARKHSGSFSVVTQSANDLNLFGRVGKVIYSNSSFKFFLQADDTEQARKMGIIDYGDFEISLLKSVKQNRPKYSEIFVDTPFGRGVTRLAVDPFSYYIYTSAPDDNKLIEDIMREENVPYERAIEILLERTHKNGATPAAPAR